MQASDISALRKQVRALQADLATSLAAQKVLEGEVIAAHSMQEVGEGLKGWGLGVGNQGRGLARPALARDKDAEQRAFAA